MKVNILHLIEGARAARGLTVIIDVFRAFSLEAYMFSGGADKIIPISSEEEAISLKSYNPEYILAGERQGRMLAGFDTGNSPSRLYLLDLSGKTVVHTTSAGTQGIYNANAASQILGGSLVNAKATAEYIRKIRAEEVSLVCMGWNGEENTDEDIVCAEYIKALLENREYDIESSVNRLRFTSGAKFFDAAQSDVFPEGDFHMCTDVDKFNFVLRLVKKEGEAPFMEKVYNI